MLSDRDLQREAATLEFLNPLNDGVEIAPELLTTEPDMQQRLRDHPGLRWKAFKVRKHHGLDGSDDG